MARFVLHVVDGAQQGQKVPLGDASAFKIGRKPGCDWTVEGDEKVSGQHCELRVEGGSIVLCDLDSTNGTRVDGKRIREIPVSHGDRFQVGKTTLELVDEELGPVADDMGIEINADLLASTSKRSPVALLALVALLAVGGAAWWFFLRPDAPQRGKKAAKVALVPGNLLSEGLAHLEKDAGSWLPLASGGGFERSGSGHTGRSALRADLGGGQADSRGSTFAVGVPAEAFPTRLNGVYRARAFVRTEGEVRVALRICFLGKAPIVDPDALDTEEDGAPRQFTQRFQMVAGTPLAKLGGDGYEELSCAASVPPGAAQVTVAIVAALDAGRESNESRVYADDISLVLAESSGVAGQHSRQIASRSVFVPDAATSCVSIHDGQQNALSSLTAMPRSGSDAVLEALGHAMPLTLADLGKPVLEVREDGFTLSGVDGRLVLRIDPDVLEGGTYLVRSESKLPTGETKSGYESYAGLSKIVGVQAVYWGDMVHRVLLTPSQPVRLDVTNTGPGGRERELRCTVSPDGATSVSYDFKLVFEEETLETIRLMREAENAYSRGDVGKALTLYRRILREKPFNAESVAKARLGRGKLLTKARRELEQLRAEFDEAQAFHYAGLYRELLRKIAALSMYESEFGTEIDQFREAVASQLDAVEKARGEHRGERLLEVARALKAAREPRLTRLISRFVSEQFPGTDAAKAAAALLQRLPESEK